MRKFTKLFKLQLLFLFFTISCFSQTTWNGTSWDNGIPNITTDAVFNGSYNSNGNLICRKVTVNNGFDVVINSGHMLTVENEVVVNGNLTFENDASLVQINPNSVNIGSIIYKRDTNPARNVDYTYWSSPVSNQILGGIFQPNEFPNWYSYIYWNEGYLPPWNSEAHIAGTWIGINNTPTANNHFTEIMEVGKGYAFQAPSSYTTPGIQHIRFTGVPNNGTITKQVLGSPFLPISNNLPCEYPPNYTNFIGNPYPSALDADSFLKDPVNNSNIYGTLGFYTHGSLPGNFNEGFDSYTARDFALYNRLGGVGTSKLNFNLPISETNSNRPTGRIASGQGFFVTTNTNTTVTFKNDMRVDGTVAGDSNGEFYRIGTIQNRTAPMVRHRIWFSIENTNVSINPRRYYESMVGYCPEATNTGADKDFDHVMTVPNIDLQIYSLKSVNDICEPLTIQGKSLPFNVDDVIPLGFIAEVNGVSNTFKIEAFADGMFAPGQQKYYLRDNQLGIIHDIYNNPYTFSLSANETNNTRFEIIFSRCAQPVNHPQILGQSVSASQSGMHHWIVTNLSTGLVANFDTVGSLFTFSQLPLNSSILNLSYSGNLSNQIPTNLFFSYGDNYFIQSFVGSNLVYSCQHNMPLLTPQMSNCSNITIPLKSTLFGTNGVNQIYSSATGTYLNNGTQNTNLTGLRYQISSDNTFNTVLAEITRVYPTNPIIHYISLQQFGVQFAPSTTYFIRVAARNSRLHWMPYGNVCTITTAATYVPKLSILNTENSIISYPNPFTTNFTLDLEAIVSDKVSIKVYDILGKLIDSHEIDTRELKTVSLGNNYNSGMYNVVIFDGDEVKTVRVVKN